MKKTVKISVKYSMVDMGCNWKNVTYSLEDLEKGLLAEDLKNYHIQTRDIIIDTLIVPDTEPLDLKDGLCSKCQYRGRRNTCKFAIKMSSTKARCKYYFEGGKK